MIRWLFLMQNFMVILKTGFLVAKASAFLEKNDTLVGWSVEKKIKIHEKYNVFLK